MFFQLDEQDDIFYNTSLILSNNKKEVLKRLYKLEEEKIDKGEYKYTDLTLQIETLTTW